MKTHTNISIQMFCSGIFGSPIANEVAQIPHVTEKKRAHRSLNQSSWDITLKINSMKI